MIGWIGVDTAFPEPNQAVLVTDGSDWYQGWWSEEDKVWYGTSFVGDRDVVLDNITHWRVVPVLPAPDGPFYIVKFPTEEWVLYKRGDNDCAHVGGIDQSAEYLKDWLNRLWAER